jgi:iron complex outermembrane receptor protein
MDWIRRFRRHKQMTRNTLLRDAINTALYGGAALALVAAPNAFAQDDAGAEQLETITVVGSRIKRTDIETSQPVFVIEREDLQKTGLTSVGDILQDLTTNGATLNTTFNNGGNGETRVDLRNLGSNRTLVLVNGRRWVSGLGGEVDLNTIPVTAPRRSTVPTRSRAWSTSPRATRMTAPKPPLTSVKTRKATAAPSCTTSPSVRRPTALPS